MEDIAQKYNANNIPKRIEIYNDNITVATKRREKNDRQTKYVPPPCGFMRH